MSLGIFFQCQTMIETNHTTYLDESWVKPGTAEHTIPKHTASVQIQSMFLLLALPLVPRFSFGSNWRQTLQQAQLTWTCLRQKTPPPVPKPMSLEAALTCSYTPGMNTRIMTHIFFHSVTHTQWISRDGEGAHTLLTPLPKGTTSSLSIQSIIIPSPVQSTYWEGNTS